MLRTGPPGWIASEGRCQNVSSGEHEKMRATRRLHLFNILNFIPAANAVFFCIIYLFGERSGCGAHPEATSHKHRFKCRKTKH